jgi:hypothetical protein
MAFHPLPRPAMRSEKAGELEPAIERSLAALASGRSALLDVFVTP